jgi:ribonucleoside-diphosphate reductase alpha chain
MQVNDWIDSNLGRDIWNNKYRFNNEDFDAWLHRVSGGDEDVKRLIRERKFLFGGRTLSNRRTGKNASYSNCYSSGYVPDSLQGIMELNTNIALTYKAQGGQGLSLSKLRPKGTKIGGQYESDGIIPFMEVFNQTTASVSQGGSRKGALMMSLSCNHKEIRDFINIKTQSDKINKANLSVEIDDNFMKAVDEYYKTGKIIELNFEEDYEGNQVEYSLKPIEIYKEIMKLAYDWAEPGVILTERFRNYNLMQYIDEYEIVTGNPCGEQPLPKNSACNLGSINLSEYVLNPYTTKAEFDMQSFNNDVRTAIKALDDVLEEGKDLHPLEEQRIMATDYRNVGLGIMGVGDAFFKLQVKYGSEQSKQVLDSIMKNMFVNAVIASVTLAQERGSFPKYDPKVFDSDIIKEHFSDKEIEMFKTIGIRNCSLLSIAPAGSIGTMLNITTGIEPAFQISYKRKTESLHKDKDVYYDVFIKSAEDYMKLNNTDKLPDYFIASSDIYWQDRVDIQAIAQKHIDTAISSTVNLPKETTVEEIEQLYLYAWKTGLKGITIYRSGCKREGILTTSEDEKVEQKIAYEYADIPRGYIDEVPEDLVYRKYKLKTGCGNLYFFVGVDENDGKIYDCFTNTDGVGGCTVNTQANSRLLSAALRGGVPVEYLIEQLNKSGVCPSFQYKKGKGETLCKGKSCPSAIANILKDIQKEFSDEEYNVANKGFKFTSEDIDKAVREVRQMEKKHSKNHCPECGDPLRNEGGCVQCVSCGYSKCS